LDQNFEDSRQQLNVHHHALIPKYITKQMLFLQYGFAQQDFNELLDIANSRISSNIAFLVQRKGSLKVVQGSFEALFTLSFKKYIESGWHQDALPDGVFELRVDIPSLQQTQHYPSQQDAWIFLYPKEDANEDSTAIFFAHDELLGIFIDANGTINQVPIPFRNQACFALTPSQHDTRVACLHATGVMIIDLNKRSVIHQVSYGANLTQWLVPYIATR